jgi:hypothetical protein
MILLRRAFNRVVGHYQGVKILYKIIKQSTQKHNVKGIKTYDVKCQNVFKQKLKIIIN